jgi:hypothetical protein
MVGCEVPLKITVNLLLEPDPCHARYSECFLLEVLDMYERELVAKSLVASDIFECSKHDTMTVYIASWQMQPHIDRARLEELETLIQNDKHYRS